MTDRPWDATADVVVVGFGGAGACAAIEAAEAGADVLVLDRFGGGGATACRGGVVYAGGGTPEQGEAGVEDTPRRCTPTCSSRSAARSRPRRCAGSATQRRHARVAGGHGVPFDGSLRRTRRRTRPTGTTSTTPAASWPVLRERSPSPPPAGTAPTAGAPRARCSSGRLAARGPRARRAGAGADPRDRPGDRRRRPGDRRRVPVRCARRRRWVRAAHRVLHRDVGQARASTYRPVGRASAPAGASARAPLRPPRAGRRPPGAWCSPPAGSSFNRRDAARARARLPRRPAAGHARATTAAASGWASAVGGATEQLDRVTVWRFLTPPAALLHGVLVGPSGERVCDESRYGAAIGDAVLHSTAASAWLLVDAALLAEARRQHAPPDPVVPAAPGVVAARHSTGSARRRCRAVAARAGVDTRRAGGHRARRTTSWPRRRRADPLGKPRRTGAAAGAPRRTR